MFWVLRPTAMISGLGLHPDWRRVFYRWPRQNSFPASPPPTRRGRRRRSHPSRARGLRLADPRSPASTRVSSPRTSLTPHRMAMALPCKRPLHGGLRPPLFADAAQFDLPDAPFASNVFDQTPFEPRLSTLMPSLLAVRIWPCGRYAATSRRLPSARGHAPGPRRLAASSAP